MRLRRGDTGEVTRGFCKVTDGTEHGEALRDAQLSRSLCALRAWPGLPYPNV